MLNKFSELIAQGVAPAKYKVNTFNDGIHQKNDGICRLYNNIWGALTDTCMTLHKNTYVITGSFVRNQTAFAQFLGAMNWGTCNFLQATRYNTLQELIDAIGCTGTFGTQNGDMVYILSPKQIE